MVSQNVGIGGENFFALGRKGGILLVSFVNNGGRLCVGSWSVRRDV